MYFRPPRRGTPEARDFKPPTTTTHMLPSEWLAAAHAVHAAARAEEAAQLNPAWALPPQLQMRVTPEELNPPILPGTLPQRPPVLPAGYVAPNASRAARAPLVPAAQWYGRPLLPAALVPPATTRGPPLPLERAPRTLYYLRASSSGLPVSTKWLGEARGAGDGCEGERIRLPLPRSQALPDFAPPRESFFMVDPSMQRGIHCRFGMTGILAESHYDTGRNAIAVLRGRRRYVISPPSECGRLAMLADGPFARHSGADWTSAAGIEEVREEAGMWGREPSAAAFSPRTDRLCCRARGRPRAGRHPLPPRLLVPLHHQPRAERAVQRALRHAPARRGGYPGLRHARAALGGCGRAHGGAGGAAAAAPRLCAGSRRRRRGRCCCCCCGDASAVDCRGCRGCGGCLARHSIRGGRHSRSDRWGICQWRTNRGRAARSPSVSSASCRAVPVAAAGSRCIPVPPGRCFWISRCRLGGSERAHAPPRRRGPVRGCGTRRPSRPRARLPC